MRITKAEYNRLGGLRNSGVYRKQGKGGRWEYFKTDIAEIYHPKYRKPKSTKTQAREIIAESESMA